MRNIAFKLIVTLLFIELSAKAQQQTCNRLADSLIVLKMAEKNGLSLKNERPFELIVKYDSKTCIWDLSSRETGFSKKGKCKHTNGCTIVKTVSMQIDGPTKKIIHKSKIKKTYPNYE